MELIQYLSKGLLFGAGSALCFIYAYEKINGSKCDEHTLTHGLLMVIAASVL